MNPMIQGLLGNLNSQAGMQQRPMGGLLGGGMPQGLLGGFHPFQPNFNTSMFQRTPYQAQRFAAPNLNPQQQQQAPAPAPAQNPFAAFGLPGNAATYQGMYGNVSPREVAYMLSAGN